MHLKYLHKLTSILDELFELKSYSLTSTVGEMMETPVDTSDKQVQCRRAPKLWHSENTSSVIKQLIFGIEPIRRKVQLIHVKRRFLYCYNSPPPCFPNNCASTITHVFAGDDGQWHSGFLGGGIFQPVSMDFSVNQHCLMLHYPCVLFRWFSICSTRASLKNLKTQLLSSETLVLQFKI